MFSAKAGVAELKASLSAVGLMCGALFLTACASYKVPSTAYGPKCDDPYYEVRRKAAQSPLYNYIPRKREQIRAYDIRWLSWCFLGNEDDGIFGEYDGRAPYSTNINLGTFCSWSILRNPLHNFDFYVIGSADWRTHYNYSALSFGGARPVRAFSNASKWQRRDKPFFDLGLNDFKPYLNFDPWLCDLYLGWRRDGSFEIKLRADLKKAKRAKNETKPSDCARRLD